jgi:hypothetical protein
VDVNVQWLSKKLGSVGIRAKKRDGRRVFTPTEEDLRLARAALGIEDPRMALGHQGQEGQQILTEEIGLAM